ncbi:MAG: TIGR00730 family Rossman fold protein [Isosphaeraceae bacterium]|nr:TIGR00730 family Rossman fold protein [Isosphaeraceae bacterium]
MKPKLSYVCVFCGSQPGVRPLYAEAARRVGAALARSGLGLVYGGGRVGLMGIVADAALAEGGRVIGVIPEALSAREIAHAEVTELIVVPGMHERKALMAAQASAFLALPGGVGTLEEFFEILTWAVLGLHNKPIGILNVDGYYDPLLHLLRHAADEGFLRPRHLELLLVSDDPEWLAVNILSHVPPPPGPIWIGPDET